MNEQSTTTKISSLPNDNDVDEIQSASSTTDSSKTQNLLPNSIVYKTARDQFFKDLQHEKDKDRWSAKCKLCEGTKRVVDKLGVTSNFTRHVKQYHKKDYEEWAKTNEYKQNKLSTKKNRITNSFQRKSAPSAGQLYGENHPRQIELSSAIVDNLIINLGLPISIVERPAFVDFMRKMDPKFSITSRRTLSRKTIPDLYDKMIDQLKLFCSKSVFLSLALDIWSDRRKRSFFAITGLIYFLNENNTIIYFLNLQYIQSSMVILKHMFYVFLPSGIAILAHYYLKNMKK